MTYVIEKKTNKAILIFLFLLDALFSFIMGCEFSNIGNGYTVRILIFCVLFISFFVMFGIAPLMYAFTTTDSSIKKRLGTYFLERLVTYISIVQKNQLWH